MRNDNDFILIAIDPGAHGAAAIGFPDGSTEVEPWTCGADFADLIERLIVRGENDNLELRAVVEQVGGFVKGNPSPGSAMFRFGENFGFIKGVLCANKVRMELVRPQAWQKGVIGLTGKQGVERKRALKNEAANRFPRERVTLANADALLILDWATRNKN